MLFYDGPKAAPNPRRVRIYLAEKGINVPTREIALMQGEHKSPEFLAKYPPGQLPVLELDDGTMIGETIAICRYFEALHPDPPMFGTDPVSIAQVDMWIRRVEFTLMVPVAQVWVHTHPLTARIVPQRFAEYGESNRPRALDAMRRIDQHLSACAYLVGDSYTMADIVLLSVVDFAGFIGLPMPDDAPALKAWHDRVSARPSAQA